MKKTVTTRYDVADHLRTPKEMAAYVEACLEEAGGDAAFIAKALGDIARAKGMAQVARDAGLSRESLYKALSGERSPGFDTILKVSLLRTLGAEVITVPEKPDSDPGNYKAIERVLPIHKAKLLSYMRLLDLPLGFGPPRRLLLAPANAPACFGTPKLNAS